MKAVILCAGRGERLMPLTEKIPKPLIKVGDKPILSFIFNSLPDEIDEVYLIIRQEKQDLFKDFIQSINIKIKIKFLFQNEEGKGSYFALLAARELLINEEKFLVLNGDDIFLKDDLEKLIKSNAPVYGLGYKKMDGRYRTCDLDEKNKKILSFRRQTEEEIKKEMPCFSGAFVLTGGFFSYAPIYTKQEAGIPHTLFGAGVDVNYLILSKWIQINNHVDLIDANKALKFNI